jgi:hypothetical protein
MVLVLLAASAWAGSDEKAREHLEKYLELRTKDDYTKACRFSIRELGKYDCPTARKALLRILKSTRRTDERVVCIYSLARVADVATLRATYAWLGRKADDALLMAWADAMSRAKPALHDWLATEALKSAPPRLLAATAEALVVLRMPDAADRLLELFETNQVELAAACTRALAALDDERVFGRAVKHADWRVRQALADQPPQEHWEALAKDPATAVRRALARGLGRTKSDDAVGLLATMLEQEPRLRTRHAAKTALTAIVGRDLGWDPTPWRRWLKEQAGEPAAKQRTFARYYGFSVISDRVIFLVDVSGSMIRPTGASTNRIQVAQQQLTRVLRGLPKGTLFNILVYSSRVHTWSKKELPADEANVRKAIAWAQRRMANPDGDTYTLPALERAFARNPEFDTLFFLSDGNPTHGRYVCPEGVLASVRAMNRYRRATIHTIALTLEGLYRGPMSGERSHLMKEFMSKLATQNEGRYQLVTRPPK